MIVAGAVTILFHRLKQPVVLGYILAGVIMSAQNLGAVSRQSDLPPSALSAAQT